MSAYPSLPIGPQTSIAPDSGRQIDQSDDGAPHARDMYPQTIYSLTVSHNSLSSAQRSTLLSFYSANKDAVDITLSLPGDSYTYTVQFSDEPQDQPILGGWWNMTVKLIGTRA